MQDRVRFTSKNGDLEAYMKALRRELDMRIVVWEIVPQTMTARFERGGGGNAHYHGFAVGMSGPKVMGV